MFTARPPQSGGNIAMNVRPVPSRRRMSSFGWALLAVTLALLTLWVRILIGSRLEGPTFIIFTIPIIISAYAGGWLPGLLATGTVVIGASYFLLPPLHSFAVFSSTHRWQLLLLVFSGALISAICEALRRSRAHAEAKETG